MKYKLLAIKPYIIRLHNEGDLRKELKNNKPISVTDIDNFLSQFKF